jgi:aminodeoxyfutalosine deaminase
VQYFKYKPDLILLPGGAAASDTVLITNPEGVIVDLVNDDQTGDCVKLEGILSPGFINCHCHLELSFLKKKVKESTGLVNFIGQIVKLRKDHSSKDIGASIMEYDNIMWENGIQAVGDICNDNSTIPVKTNSKITYFNFLEVFDLIPDRTRDTLNRAQQLRSKFIENKLPCALTPHAPYTVTIELYAELMRLNILQNVNINTIHFLESGSEDLLFAEKKGELFDTMNGKGIDYSWVPDSINSAFEMIAPNVTPGGNFLFVHNTFLTQPTIDAMQTKGIIKNSWFCMCPNANMFIENTLPDIPLLMKNELQLVIGTDSLASNHQLSMISEINTIKSKYPSLPINELLKWATENGAAFFGWDHLGTFKKGNKPGAVLIAEKNSGNYSAKRIF